MWTQRWPTLNEVEMLDLCGSPLEKVYQKAYGGRNPIMDLSHKTPLPTPGESRGPAFYTLRNLSLQHPSKSLVVILCRSEIKVGIATMKLPSLIE